MFDTQSPDPRQRPFKLVSIAHMARGGNWTIDATRSFLVPVLFWFTSGQGRMNIDGEVRGYTPHNAIYLPANTPHACEIGPRVQGTALFIGAPENLPLPPCGIHLRLQLIQKQAEFNQHVDAMLRTATEQRPHGDQILWHQAALTLLWLVREAEATRYSARLTPSRARTDPDEAAGQRDEGAPPPDHT